MTPGSEPLARPIAEDLQQLAGRLLQAEYDTGSLAQRLHTVRQITEDLEHYTAAAIAEARTHKGATWKEIADAAQCPPDTARTRWRLSEVERKLDRRRAARRNDRTPGQTRTAPAVMPRGQVKVPGRARADSTHPAGPHQLLAAALSQLHRECGKTIRHLAGETGVSPSYISRVLSGERSPSWPLTCRLATVCAGDPVDLRALWETARGIWVPDQAPADALPTLRAALRGLYLSAARPAPARIYANSRGQLTTETVNALIRGTFLSDWDAVGRFVTALRGRPADIRPLWDAARAASDTAHHQNPGVQASPLLAAHFG